MKLNIKTIYEEIPMIFNKYTIKKENKSLSDKFIFDLYDIRKEYNNIKKIDIYNLDIKDDEKCIKIFKNIMKLLIEEIRIQQIINNKNNEIKTIHNLKYEDTKKLNINDLNTKKDINNENDINSIIIKSNVFDSELLNNDNKKKIQYISEYNSKNNKINKSTQNEIYNFEYGKNAEEYKFLE